MWKRNGSRRVSGSSNCSDRSRPWISSPLPARPEGAFLARRRVVHLQLQTVEPKAAVLVPDEVEAQARPVHQVEHVRHLQERRRGFVGRDAELGAEQDSGRRLVLSPRQSAVRVGIPPRRHVHVPGRADAFEQRPEGLDRQQFALVKRLRRNRRPGSQRRLRSVIVGEDRHGLERQDCRRHGRLLSTGSPALSPTRG